ncbi:MAG: aromatic ring-hydroxylating dioxygenase subunit alpha [Proteobacteria bacterium]|nr:aromatic ring-hydroxylating dioxygenase subunit alpha [Pseudomonadota bacterium]
MSGALTGIGVERFLDREVMAALARPLEQARGLPSAAFTDEAFLALERRLLFSRTWVFAGRAGDLAKPGDVRPVEVAGRPLLLVRGREGDIRAFHNVCPHRGARLVGEAQDGRTMLTCPYHAWTYTLDGRLKARPHFHRPDCHDQAGDDNVTLFPVRCVTWHDWIFVNLDGKAEPFEDFIAPVSAWFDGFDLSAVRCASHRAWEFDCNWKLAVENYCDFYHVFLVHPALHQVMAKEARKAMLTMGRHLMNEYWFEADNRGGLGDKSGFGMPLFPELSAANQNRTCYSVVFPNIAINVYPTNAQFVHFEPLSAGRTRMHMWFYYVGDAASDPAHASLRDTVVEEWHKLNMEDEGICRAIQAGRHCDAYDGGRLAPYWDTGTLHFHRQIAQVMTAA